MKSSQPDSRNLTRRRFLEISAVTTASTCAASSLAAPAIATEKKSDSKVILGSGDYKYEVIHDFAKLPKKFTWQTTHNVAIDKDGNLFVIHEGHRNKKDHPSIFMFNQKGKYIRSFGSEFQGGGHGLEVRQEGKEQFLYVTAYQHLKNFSKLSLQGERVWQKHAPMKSGHYAKGEDTNPKKSWGRNRFMPTNFAFHKDGGFYLADGYGAWQIHRYDKDAKWLSSFGGAGKGDGKFNLPHGLWIDDRKGRKPSLAVADRANGRLQWFSLDGKHQKTLGGFILPANIDTHEEVMLIPDLSARITLLDAKDKVIVQLGEDPAWRKEMKKHRNMRATPKYWQAGKFIHPHDACFDAQGNIYIAEWVATGRITKLRRLS